MPSTQVTTGSFLFRKVKGWSPRGRVSFPVHERTLFTVSRRRWSKSLCLEALRPVVHTPIWFCCRHLTKKGGPKTALNTLVREISTKGGHSVPPFYYLASTVMMAAVAIAAVITANGAEAKTDARAVAWAEAIGVSVHDVRIGSVRGGRLTPQ
jgi:hypothetical protein